MFTLT